MKVNRLSLLILATAALGAAAVATAGARPNSPTSSPSSSSEPITQVDGGSVAFSNEPISIPANNVAQRVADIRATDDDSTYQLRVESGAMTVTSQGQTVGVCTGISSTTRYTVVDDPILPYSFTHNFGPTIKIGELRLTIPPSVANNCVVRKAVVQVILTAVGPDVP